MRTATTNTFFGAWHTRETLPPWKRLEAMHEGRFVDFHPAGSRPDHVRGDKACHDTRVFTYPSLPWQSCRRGQLLLRRLVRWLSSPGPTRWAAATPDLTLSDIPGRPTMPRKASSPLIRSIQATWWPPGLTGYGRT